MFLKRVFSFFYSLEKYFIKFTDIANLASRFYLAKIFFYSGLTKTRSLKATYFLFEEVYKVPLLNYKLAAIITMFAELVLAPLLLLGFLTRYVSLYFIGMTLVINYTYQSAAENYYWMLILAMLATYGGGRISIDTIIKKRISQDKD